jgi:hypothetical protein
MARLEHLVASRGQRPLPLLQFAAVCEMSLVHLSMPHESHNLSAVVINCDSRFQPLGPRRRLCRTWTLRDTRRAIQAFHLMPPNE